MRTLGVLTVLFCVFFQALSVDDQVTLAQEIDQKDTAHKKAVIDVPVLPVKDDKVEKKVEEKEEQLRDGIKEPVLVEKPEANVSEHGFEFVCLIIICFDIGTKIQ